MKNRTILNRYELPARKQKSFYGRAAVEEVEYTVPNTFRTGYESVYVTELLSYGMRIAQVDKFGQNIKLLADDVVLSRTTRKHLKAFIVHTNTNIIDAESGKVAETDAEKIYKILIAESEIVFAQIVEADAFADEMYRIHP